MIHREELDLLEVPEAPEEDLKPVPDQFGPDVWRDGEDGPTLGHGQNLLLDVGELGQPVHAIDHLEHLKGGEQLPRLLIPSGNSVPLQTRGRVKLLNDRIVAYIYSFKTYHVLIKVHCCSGECSSDELSFIELKSTMILVSCFIVVTLS